VTENQIELGRHALGLPNKRKTSHRNHFCASAGHTDYEDWLQMVAQGNARIINGNALSGGDDVFSLTRGGAEQCLAYREKLDVEDFPVLR
jgi:hypothetical protein